MDTERLCVKCVKCPYVPILSLIGEKTLQFLLDLVQITGSKVLYDIQ